MGCCPSKPTATAGVKVELVEQAALQLEERAALATAAAAQDKIAAAADAATAVE